MSLQELIGLLFGNNSNLFNQEVLERMNNWLIFNYLILSATSYSHVQLSQKENRIEVLAFNLLLTLDRKYFNKKYYLLDFKNNIIFDYKRHRIIKPIYIFEKWYIFNLILI